jgi:hypothetical protein
LGVDIHDSPSATLFAGTVKAVGDFEKILPDEITMASVRSGEELVLTYDHAQRAVEMATEHVIAVLGVELFRILDNGLGVETYSGYCFELGLWWDFVEHNNREASLFLAQNRRGDGYGYILTT